MPDNAHVQNALLLSIDVEEGVDFFVVQGSDLASAQVEGDGSQSEILGDVSCVQVNIPVGPLFVFPFGSFKKRGPDKQANRA